MAGTEANQEKLYTGDVCTYGTKNAWVATNWDKTLSPPAFSSSSFAITGVSNF
jgi:hypothetical protein